MSSGAPKPASHPIPEEPATAEDLSRDVERWRAELRRADGNAVAAHRSLARLLYALDRKVEAVPHLRAAAAQSPDDFKICKRLAVCLGQTDDVDGEIAAWRRVLVLNPHEQLAHVRLAALLEQRGRPGEAAAHARVLALALPDNPHVWTRLARLLTQDDDLDAAIVAWTRVATFEEISLEAHDRLAQLKARRRRAAAGPAAQTAPRIAVLGNCQAFGIGACLRALIPDAEVMTVQWASLLEAGLAEAQVADLVSYDLVVSQRSESEELGPFRASLLGPRVRQLALAPSIHFTGFHPDVVWLPKGPWRAWQGRLGPYHSALAMAGFTMGLPRARTAELFNAYLYGVLGYFDEYAIAERFHVTTSKVLDVDLAPVFAEQRLGRPFMHTPNHPTMSLTWAITRRLCDELGLSTGAADIPADPFAKHIVWPVYPEIAKRLGVQGSLTFKAVDGVIPQIFDLEAMIDDSYALYATLDPEVLRLPRVTATVEALRREGV